MTAFASILRPSCVAIDVEAADKDAALAAAAELLAVGNGDIDAAALLTEILAREATISTGIGEGIAVPHALSEGIPRTAMAILRLAKPIDYAALDGADVDLLFLLAGPRDDSQAHLQLLSKLARLLHDEAFRRIVREVPSAAELARLFYEKD